MIVQPKKKQRNKYRKYICYYCGEKPSESRDHIPDKKILPNRGADFKNLIWAPSCKDCNKKLERDEVYFWSRLSTCQSFLEHPSSPEPYQRFMRNITHKDRILSLTGMINDTSERWRIDDNLQLVKNHLFL